MTIVFEATGVSLSLRGIANESGHRGARIAVLNPAPKKVQQVSVIGPARVSVSPPCTSAGGASRCEPHPARRQLSSSHVCRKRRGDPELSLPRSLAALALSVHPGAGLSACNTPDQLASIGATPKLSAIEDPTAQPGYKPVRMPMPDVQAASYAPNSL